MPDTGDNYFDAHRFIGRDLHEAVLVKTVHDLVSISSILDTILQTYDDDQLFRIALHSDDHWNIVSTYLAKATVQPTHPASTINYAGPPAIASFPLQHLPVEVRARLLLFMDLRILYDYSATCKAIHLNVNRHIGRFMKKTFARIGLSWPNLRFMLAHTDSLLSGYQIHRLLFPGFTARGNTDVDVLDMFVHDFAAGVVSRFFEITTGFKIDRVKKKPSYWISSMFTLVHELPHLFPIKIAVHVAEEDEYPQMAAFRQKLTCNFPFMTGYGIVVPYAAFNFGGNALINHQYVPLNTNADNRKFKPKWAAPTIMASKSETITSTMTLVELPTFRVPRKSILLQTKRVLLPRSTKNAGPIQQTPIGPVLRIRYYDYSDRSVDFRVPLLQDT
ncbi:hypothetical protein B0H11DRAFT_1943248 [Mycena galericulata]|nr:hypothetical protein B0H11DRAFT_1943248 [Mycena galericulata]